MKPTELVFQKFCKEFRAAVLEEALKRLNLQSQIPAPALPKPRSPLKRIRRSPRAIADLSDEILRVLKTLVMPASRDAIAGVLRREPKELQHALTALFDREKIAKSGRGPGTRYSLAP